MKQLRTIRRSSRRELWTRWDVSHVFCNAIEIWLIRLAYVLHSDIDYEYPSNQEQGAGFAALLTSLRNAFNQLSGKIGGGARFQLTVCKGVSFYITWP